MGVKERYWARTKKSEWRREMTSAGAWEVQTGWALMGSEGNCLNALASDWIGACLSFPLGEWQKIDFREGRRTGKGGWSLVRHELAFLALVSSSN